MKQAYNKKIIEVNSHINNLTPQQIETLLDLRSKNFESSDYQMFFDDLRTIIAYDHLVCKKIQEKSAVDNNLKTYLNKLNQQLLNEPFLFFSLPISKLNSSELRNYISNIDIILNKCSEIFKRVQQIKGKIKNNEKISLDEVNFLIRFLDYYITYDRVANNSVKKEDDINIFKEVAEYLLQQKELGLHSASLIMKYFGYKKCIEEGLDDIEIIISKLKDNELGKHSSNFVTVSKKSIINTTFLNNTLEKENRSLNNSSLEGVAILKTLYHEIRHGIQDKERYLNNETDLSYSMAMRRIFSVLDTDEYDRNYPFYDIEADANLYGYRELCKTLRDYIPESQILQNLSDQLAYKYSLKYHFNIKKEELEKKQLIATGWFEKKMLDQFFQLHPEKLQTEYPQFKKFYNADGTSIQLTDLLSMQHSSEYDNFFLNQIIARFKEEEGLYKSKIDGYTLEQRKEMIWNIDRIIYLLYSKISFFKDRLTLNNHFSIENFGVPEQKFLASISKGYYKVAKKYAYYTSRLVQLYPELSQSLYSRIENINIIIDKINKDIDDINKVLSDDLKIETEEIPLVEQSIVRR